MIFKKILRFLNPSLPIGGLEISDLSLRYADFTGGRIKQAEVRLSPGTIKEGRVRDKTKLIEALTSLREKLGGRGEILNAVVTIYGGNIYTQIFSLPPLSKDRIEEAARLNLELISPTSLDETYADWQFLGEGSGEEGQFDFLAAFVGASFIEELTLCLRAAGFLAAAIEFTPLSLIRLMQHRSEPGHLDHSHLILNVSSDGIDFIILSRGRFSFSHSYSWQVVNQLGLEKFLVEEVRRALHFYNSRWGGKIEELFLSASALDKEIREVLERNFQLQIKTLVPPAASPFARTAAPWYPVLGAALRGLVPRAEDNLISLTRLGTEQEFYEHQILYFTRIWRNIILTSLLVIFLIYFFINELLLNVSEELNERLAVRPKADLIEVNQLIEEAKKFNEMVALAEKADAQASPQSDFFEKLRQITVTGVKISRTFFDSASKSVLIAGRAKDETAVLAFKNALISWPAVGEVTLPLSDITVKDGQAFFQLTLRLK